MLSSSHSIDPSPAVSDAAAPQVWSIAVLPGDGIGPEVVTEGVKVLRAVATRLTGVDFTLTEYAVGAAEFLRIGDQLPDPAFRACREADTVLLGAMGLPSVRWPSGKEMTPQIDLRERLDLYCGLRPIRLYHESHTPLKGFRAGDIDFVIVRESTEGLFSARLSKSSPDHLAVAVPDTDAALTILRDQLGFPLLYSEVVNGGKVRLTHLDLGNTHLQLVEPLTADHPLQAWLEKNGPALHHLYLKVHDVAEAGAAVPVPAAPHQGTQGKRALFLGKAATQGVQVELTGK